MVEFVIGKKGLVESANAVEGHPFLRAISEVAIRNSKFTVSNVNNESVETLGVIIYEFILSKGKWQTRIVDYKLKVGNTEVRILGKND